MEKRRFVTLEIDVTTADTRYSEVFTLDKNIKKVKGIALFSDYENRAYYRGRIGVEINNGIIFPENKLAKGLISAPSVEPERKFYSLGDLDSGNSEVKVVYTDVANTNAAFVAYKIFVELDCEE